MVEGGNQKMQAVDFLSQGEFSVQVNNLVVGLRLSRLHNMVIAGFRMQSAFFFTCWKANLIPRVANVFDRPTQGIAAVMKMDSSELVEHLQK